MKIVLSNNTELSPIVVTGGKRHVHGASRDALSFVFHASEGIEKLDALFTADNCESVIIESDNGSSYIYKGYTVRASMSKETVEVEPSTAEKEAVYEERITVVMAQRTYAESQLASLTDTVDVLVMESLMN